MMVRKGSNSNPTSLGHTQEPMAGGKRNSCVDRITERGNLTIRYHSLNALEAG
jgi:hypothetical protein